MVTPRTEGSASAWPQVHGLEQFHDPGMLPTPGPAGITPSLKRNDWMNSQMTVDDFQPMSSLSGFPDMNDGVDMNNLGFMSLPSDDDWNRWHAGSADVATDLDGFPPRGRTQVHNFASPPMGGIMDG